MRNNTVPKVAIRMSALLFAQVIHNTEAWLDALDRERDLAVRAKPSPVTETWRRWVDDLERERDDVTALIGELRALEERKPLLFVSRPSRTTMIKAGVQRTHRTHAARRRRA